MTSKGQRPTTGLSGVWYRFRKHRLAVCGLGVLLALVVVAVFAPQLSPEDPYKMKMGQQYQPPSKIHLLGTDSIGRDNLARLLYGTRISLSVGLVAVAISMVLGSSLGVIAGFFGGRLDSVLSRVADMVMSFPAMIVILTIVSVLGPNIINVMLVIGFLYWPQFFRLIRGETLSIKQREFVLAGHAVGASNGRILLRHILPNTLAPVIVGATLRMATAILMEASLSFLGMGVQPPLSSWGNMLMDAQSLTVLSQFPWVWIPPGLMISVTVLSINFVGDGLRDALDPKSVH